MSLLSLSRSLEALLVRRNPRSMASLRDALEPGYCLRAARVLSTAERVIIATGFPVDDTFETDGPAGAIALYKTLEMLGSECHLVCADPLARKIRSEFRVLELQAFDIDAGRREAEKNLDLLKPDAIVSIERPGLAADNRYYNMRGEDISPRCAVFDFHITKADCPTIGIGDGGNEIGMGNVSKQVAALNIKAAATPCDELLVADVSNWGAYALIAMLQALCERPLLASITHRETLAYLSSVGSVDGVTRENTLTEDGLPAAEGEHLLHAMGNLLSEFENLNSPSPPAQID